MIPPPPFTFTQVMFSRTASRLHCDATGVALLQHFHHHYSTAAAAASTSFMADYMTASLGFSKDEAASSILRMTPRTRPITKNPDSVVSFFQTCGFDKSQIKYVVRLQPNLLLCNLDKTLKPKIEFLQDLGISGIDLAKFLMGNTSFLGAGLDSHTKPRIEYLKKLVGDDDDKLSVLLKRCPSLLVYSASKTLEQNILALKRIGFSDKNILKFLVRRPKALVIKKPEWFEEVGKRVKDELGITPQSSLFYSAVEILDSYKKATLKAKYEVFRSFGWSETDIRALVKGYPLVLAASRGRLRKTLAFLMYEVQLDSRYLAARGKFFSVGLEKRVILRYDVVKALNDKGLSKKKRCLYSVVSMSEPDFFKGYLLPHKDEVPDLYESYVKQHGD